MNDNGDGVWITWMFDYGVHVASIHREEIEAYRAAEDYHKVTFVPFGADVSAIWQAS